MVTWQNLPDVVVEYEDFVIEWTFKVMNSSGDWVAAYTEDGQAHSQGTHHLEIHPGDRDYGLFVTYDTHKFANAADFIKDTLAYACEYARGENSPDPMRQALMDNGFPASGSSTYQYLDGGNCHILASAYARMCQSLGIVASLRRWSAATDDTVVGNCVRMYPKEFDPAGSMTWAGFQSSFPTGWGWHQWVESGGKQYDPSAGRVLTGNWGAYEDECFSNDPGNPNHNYYKIVDPPPTAVWVAGESGREQGCTDSEPTLEPWRAPPGGW
jgi:hypothetical protein